MDRRQFLQGITIGTFALGSNILSAKKEGYVRRLNVVLIMADDLGWKELGCYGQEKIKTPNIDRLAAEGMMFTQAYSGSAVCAPARCCLMTGMHGGHAYIRNNGEIKNSTPDRYGGQTPIPQSAASIAKTFKKNGYATGCFGKWGLGGQGSTGDPLTQGFDRFFGYNCQRNAHNLYPKYLEDDDGVRVLKGNERKRSGKEYAPQLIADEMIGFVKQSKDRPFFLYYPTVIPHLALQVPEKELAQYKGKWEETPYKGRGYQKHDTPKACYAAMISFMDRQVGRLMGLLKELGLDENTIVVFTSDNGTTHLKNQVDYEFFNSVGPLRGLKGQLYEGGIRVPLIARWPGRIKPGTSSDLPVGHYDLAVTLAEMAGVSYDYSTDGISIRPTLAGKDSKQEKHEFLFWDFAGYGGQIAVRMGKWKGIKKGVAKNKNAALELYNLDDDIGEKNDLAGKYPEIVKRIENIMLRERTVPELKKFHFGEYK